jgi:hypothetical protein
MGGAPVVQHDASPTVSACAPSLLAPTSPRAAATLRSAASDASAIAQRLTKLADSLSGAVEHARTVGLTDEQIADHLAGLGDRVLILATLAAGTDGSAIRYLVASLAAEPGVATARRGSPDRSEAL